MSIQILPFTMADYDEVAAFWRQQEGVGLNESDERGPIAGHLARNPGMSFVARESGRVIGAVLCGHDGRRGYLHHLAVARSQRRQGLGRDLVRRCLPSSLKPAFSGATCFFTTAIQKAASSGMPSGSTNVRTCG